MFEQDYPHDTQAEISLLGAILLEPEIIKNTALDGSQFYNPNLGYLYDVMHRMDNAGMVIDAVTIASDMPRKKLEEIGGMKLLMELTSSTPTTSNAEGYERIIKTTYNERKAILAAQKIIEDIRQGEGIENVASDIVAMQDVIDTTKADEDGDITPHLINIHERYSQPIESGVASGLKSYDAITGGFKEQDLNILAARPAMGKTAVMVQDAINRVRSNDKVMAVIFSLEMSAELMLERFINNIGMIDNVKNQNPYELYDTRDWEKLSTAVGVLSEMPIKIFDNGTESVASVRKTLRKLQDKYPDYKLFVYIDYIQLMHGEKKGNREQEVSSVSRGLKAIAKEFNTTVVALAQLSRSVEQRQDKRPLLSDLRESGSIEQDASVVTFLYRDEYYDDNSEDKGVIEQIVAKNRHGMTGTAKFAFIGKYSAVTELQL